MDVLEASSPGTGLCRHGAADEKEIGDHQKLRRHGPRRRRVAVHSPRCAMQEVPPEGRHS